MTRRPRDLDAVREQVFQAALQGRAEFLPAGGEGAGVATILVDGLPVGEAITVGHFVRTAPGAPRFARSILLPERADRLPRHLARLLPGAQ